MEASCSRQARAKPSISRASSLWTLRLCTTYTKPQPPAGLTAGSPETHKNAPSLKAALNLTLNQRTAARVPSGQLRAFTQRADGRAPQWQPSSSFHGGRKESRRRTQKPAFTGGLRIYFRQDLNTNFCVMYLKTKRYCISTHKKMNRGQGVSLHRRKLFHKLNQAAF